MSMHYLRRVAAIILIGTLAAVVIVGGLGLVGVELGPMARTFVAVLIGFNAQRVADRRFPAKHGAQAKT